MYRRPLYHKRNVAQTFPVKAWCFRHLDLKPQQERVYEYQVPDGVRDSSIQLEEKGTKLHLKMQQERTVVYEYSASVPLKDGTRTFDVSRLEKTPLSPALKVVLKQNNTAKIHTICSGPAANTNAAFGGICTPPPTSTQSSTDHPHQE